MRHYTGDMAKDLKVLCPILIADHISHQYAPRLVSIAEGIYKKDPDWAKKITDTSTGRKRLRALMRHWYLGFLCSGRWIDEQGVQ